MKDVVNHCQILSLYNLKSANSVLMCVLLCSCFHDDAPTPRRIVAAEPPRSPPPRRRSRPIPGGTLPLLSQKVLPGRRWRWWATAPSIHSGRRRPRRPAPVPLRLRGGLRLRALDHPVLRLGDAGYCRPDRTRRGTGRGERGSWTSGTVRLPSPSARKSVPSTLDVIYGPVVFPVPFCACGEAVHWPTDRYGQGTGNTERGRWTPGKL